MIIIRDIQIIFALQPRYAFLLSSLTQIKTKTLGLKKKNFHLSIHTFCLLQWNLERSKMPIFLPFTDFGAHDPQRPKSASRLQIFLWQIPCSKIYSRILDCIPCTGRSLQKDPILLTEFDIQIHFSPYITAQFLPWSSQSTAEQSICRSSLANLSSIVFQALES